MDMLEDNCSVDAKDVIKKFGLKSPDAIFDYVKEHYGSFDGYDRLKKDFCK